VGRLGSWAITIALLALCTVRAQEPTFRVDVKLVHVLATVKDNYGKLIGGLNKEDFLVYDNGVPQEVRVFARQTEQPLSITLLVDISGSTAKDLKYEIDSVQRFLHALFREGNPDDSVSLYSFNWQVTLNTGFTRNLPMLTREMKGFKAEAGTALYDAIWESTKPLRHRDGRHVVVVVTDGGDTVSAMKYHDALRALHIADSVFYAILVMPITNDVGRNIGGENALTTLAQGTGGQVFSPSLGRAMDQAFDDILRDLRTQYSLSYYPKNTPLSKDPFHRLEVKTKTPDLRVISRNGYYGDSIH
jgi:Ca-activated chloride channel family protein